MKLKNMLDKKLNRNRFLVTAGTGIAGFFLFKSFTFSILSKKVDPYKKEVLVKINPHSVSRQKVGNGNGR